MNNKIFLLSEEEFVKKLDIFPYADASKQNIRNAYLNFVNFMKRENYISDNNMVVDKDKIDEIVINFLNDKYSFGLKSVYRTCLKPIFILHNLEFDRSKYVISNYEEFDDVSDKFLTEEEFHNEISVVYNASDKLLLCMAYYDVIGNDFENVTNARPEYIDFKTKRWLLSDGRILDFSEDAFLEDIIKATVEQKEYIPYTKPFSTGNIPNFYVYNENCQYLFKTRRHPQTRDGMAPLYKEGVKRAYIRLSKEFGKMFTRNNLKISRVLNIMYQVEPSPDWSINEIRKLKKDLKLKFTETDIKVFYLQKYFPESIPELGKFTKVDKSKQAEKAEKIEKAKKVEEAEVDKAE